MLKINRVLSIAALSYSLSSTGAIAQPSADQPRPPINAKGMTAGAATDKFLTAPAQPIYFPLTLPDQANTRFGKVSFTFTDASQESGVAPLQFNLGQIAAFSGSPDRMGAAITIKSRWIDETGTLWLQFDPAVAAHTKLTITLKTQTLPPPSTYGYSIAAYSETQPPRAIFVEDGTLTVNP